MKKRRILAALTALTTGVALALAGMMPAAATSTDDGTIRELAAKAGVLFGSGAINPSYLDDPQFGDVLGEQFNSLSPENELKWTFVEPQRGVFDFAGLDRLVDFATQHDMVVKGHGLISGCCNPDYVNQITDPDQLRGALTEHFQAVMGHYAGKMDRWDVVTEPLATLGGEGLVHNHFYDVLGAGYIADAFRIAHQADPSAKLFLNENLVESIPAKSKELYDLVASLVADGVPIDGVGLQMHETYTGPDPGVLTNMVNSYHALGLEVAVTELDVHTYDSAQQAQIYGDVVAEALAAGVKDISTWGFTDKHLYTWLPGAKPLMFDEQYNPKPAYFSVVGALKSFTIGTSAPSPAKLSHTSVDNGSYAVAMNLGRGTPGSFYRLYENGVLVDARALDATSGVPQSVSTTFTAKANGIYKYRAELVNSEGVTKTNTTVVNVRGVAPTR